MKPIQWNLTHSHRHEAVIDGKLVTAIDTPDGRAIELTVYSRSEAIGPVIKARVETQSGDVWKRVAAAMAGALEGA